MTNKLSTKTGAIAIRSGQPKVAWTLICEQFDGQSRRY